LRRGDRLLLPRGRGLVEGITIQGGESIYLAEGFVGVIVVCSLVRAHPLVVAAALGSEGQ
jgi:hypothetical protein